MYHWTCYILLFPTLFPSYFLSVTFFFLLFSYNHLFYVLNLFTNQNVQGRLIKVTFCFRSSGQDVSIPHNGIGKCWNGKNRQASFLNSTWQVTPGFTHLTHHAQKGIPVCPTSPNTMIDIDCLLVPMNYRYSLAIKYIGRNLANYYRVV